MKIHLERDSVIHTDRLRIIQFVYCLMHYLGQVIPELSTETFQNKSKMWCVLRHRQNFPAHKMTSLIHNHIWVQTSSCTD